MSDDIRKYLNVLSENHEDISPEGSVNERDDDDFENDDDSEYKFSVIDYGTYLTNPFDETMFIPFVWLNDQGFRQNDSRLPEVWEMNMNEPDTVMLGSADSLSKNKNNILKSLLRLAKQNEEKIVYELINEIARMGANWNELDSIKQYFKNKKALSENENTVNKREEYTSRDIDRGVYITNPSEEVMFIPYTWLDKSKPLTPWIWGELWERNKINNPDIVLLGNSDSLNNNKRNILKSLLKLVKQGEKEIVYNLINELARMGANWNEFNSIKQYFKNKKTSNT